MRCGLFPKIRRIYNEPMYKGACALLLAGVVAGIFACNNLMTPTDSPAELGKTSTSTAHPAGAIKNSSSPAAMPNVLARVMVTKDGQLIGILFSTPESDYCQSRNGTPQAFSPQNGRTSPRCRGIGINIGMHLKKSHSGRLEANYLAGKLTLRKRRNNHV